MRGDGFSSLGSGKERQPDRRRLPGKYSRQWLSWTNPV